MVEIFRTNVTSEKEAVKILTLLKQTFKELTINFDLEDCDNILRMEGEDIAIDEVLTILEQANIKVEILYGS